MKNEMNRVFLGWDGALLTEAATWLVQRFGADMRGVVVALPGARAGRILQEVLAREVGTGLRPPEVVTAGVLSDELLDVEGAAAGRLVRTLAWERALRELAADELARVVARPPEADDLRAWATLAEEVRGLFGEVAAEGLEFAAVAESPVLAALPGEVQRWRALATAQRRMAGLLREAGVHDPHLGRLAAIEAGRGRQPRHVVLVGVVEMNELLRRALALCASPRTALVFAPDAEDHGFDGFGCLVPGAWTTRETPLALEQWHVVDRPRDQARAAARVIARWGAVFRAEQITIGLADAEVSPYVKSRFAESGIRARDAAGVAMARTAAVRLVAAVGAFLRSGSYLDFAALVRHPDFESALRRVAPRLEPIETLDAYHGAHLPWRADGNWAADAAAQRDVWRASRDVLGSVFGDRLGDGRTLPPAPIGQHTAALRRLLERVYGTADLDTGSEGDRVLLASLRCLARGLTELAELPAGLTREGTLPDAIELLLRVVSNKSNAVPAAAARAGEPTIEMLGWLELPLDDAPALVVTGFADGNVPGSVRGDAYLPNRLRRDLGIVDNERRLARDMYATALLVHSRERVAFITGRRNLAGDPLVPSRVVFHCAEDEVAPRVRRFLRGQLTADAPAAVSSAAVSSAAVSPTAGAEATEQVLPRRSGLQIPEEISVSAFKTFLDSPYAYYLKHVLKLDTLDDRAREMDGAAFGDLAHAVLQRFGQDTVAREEQDPAKITAFLVETSRELAAEIYGHRPLPAVQLQLRQLELRLQRFAPLQADRRAQGWRIHAVEWQPEGGTVDLLVDDAAIRLRGRIDRIDYHEGRDEWAIWDYKTGESVKRPATAHRRGDGNWIDLQLPLYRYLARELLAGAEPAELGYIALGRDDAGVGFWHETEWRRPKNECDDPGEPLDTALQLARYIVGKIRAGEVFHLKDWHPYDEIFGAIGGVGVVESAAAFATDGEEGAE